MTPERHSCGYKIAIAIQNMRDTNERLSRTLPDINERIAANVEKVRADFDLTWAEFYLWSNHVR